MQWLADEFPPFLLEVNTALPPIFRQSLVPEPCQIDYPYDRINRGHGLQEESNSGTGMVRLGRRKTEIPIHKDRPQKSAMGTDPPAQARLVNIGGGIQVRSCHFVWTNGGAGSPVA